MTPAERTKETLRFFVERLGDRAGRTFLVKMLYLADLEAHKHLGRPITGLKYRRDQNGPFDPAFYVARDALVAQGAITEHQVQFPSGVGYRYEVKQPGTFAFDDADARILAYVLREYGDKKLAALLEDVVYETKPFQSVKDQHGAELPMAIVDNEAVRDLGGIRLDSVVRGEVDAQAGRTTTLEEWTRALQGTADAGSSPLD